MGTVVSVVRQLVINIDQCHARPCRTTPFCSPLCLPGLKLALGPQTRPPSLTKPRVREFRVERPSPQTRFQMTGILKLAIEALTLASYPHDAAREGVPRRTTAERPPSCPPCLLRPRSSQANSAI